jgi:hypothetical protein
MTPMISTTRPPGVPRRSAMIARPCTDSPTFRVSIGASSVVVGATVVVVDSVVVDSRAAVVVDAWTVVAGTWVVADAWVIGAGCVVVATLLPAVGADATTTVEAPVESEPSLQADTVRAAEIRHAAAAERRICMPATVTPPHCRWGDQPSYQ